MGFAPWLRLWRCARLGLGGDSAVHLERDGLSGGLVLGPRRVLPVALAAQQFPDVILPALERQISSERLGENDGRFVVPIRHSGHAPTGLSEREARVLGRVGDAAWEMGKLLSNRMEQAALRQLVARGLVMISGVTPSDAAHVLGILDSWDGDAARAAVELFSRQRNGAGQKIASGAQEMARAIIDQVTAQTAETLLEAAFAEDETDFGVPSLQLARHVLAQRGMAHHRGLVALDVGLNLPVIGLGASAPSYYGAVGERLSTRMVLPEHAGVANAIGAVVGQISMRKSGQITSAGEGRFRVHFPDGPEDFGKLDAAISALATHLGDLAASDARASGAEGVRVRVERDMRMATIEGKEVFVEADLTAVATGRPRIAV